MSEVPMDVAAENLEGAVGKGLIGVEEDEMKMSPTPVPALQAPVLPSSEHAILSPSCPNESAAPVVEPTAAAMPVATVNTSSFFSSAASPVVSSAPSSVSKEALVPPTSSAMPDSSLAQGSTSSLASVSSEASSSSPSSTDSLVPSTTAFPRADIIQGLSGSPSTETCPPNALPLDTSGNTPSVSGGELTASMLGSPSSLPLVESSSKMPLLEAVVTDTAACCPIAVSEDKLSQALQSTSVIPDAIVHNASPSPSAASEPCHKMYSVEELSALALVAPSDTKLEPETELTLPEVPQTFDPLALYGPPVGASTGLLNEEHGRSSFETSTTLPSGNSTITSRPSSLISELPSTSSSHSACKIADPPSFFGICVFVSLPGGVWLHFSQTPLSPVHCLRVLFLCYR